MTVRQLISRYSIQQAMHWGTVGLLFPVMVRLIQALGMSLLQVGTLMATYSAMTLLLELPTGGLADRLGRKRVYLFALAVQWLGVLSFLFTNSYLTAMISAGLLGAARALSSGTLDAWFIERYRELHQKEDASLQQALARIQVVVGVSLAATALLGGFLPSWAAGVSLLTTPYHANLFLMLVWLPFVAGYVVYAIHETVSTNQLTQRANSQQVHKIIAQAAKLGIQPQLRWMLLPVIAIGLALSAIETFWQPVLTQLLADPIGLSWMFGVTGTGYFIAQAVGSSVSSRLGRTVAERTLLISSLVLFGCCLPLLGLSSEPWLFVSMVWLCIAIYMIGTSPYHSLLHARIPDSHRSTMASLQSLLLQLGGLIGSVLFGAIAEAVGFKAVFAIAGMVIALSAACFVSQGASMSTRAATAK